MLWDGNRQIQEYVDGLVFTTVYDDNSFVPVARLVSKDDKLKVYYYHTDHLGTPNELTDSEGNVIWLADYNAWGGVSEICEDFKYQKQTINDIVIDEIDLQPIRFQGQFFDVETGLHYNRFRYYDNDVGMFVSRDPIGLSGGSNVFQYAPNPVSWVDPLGLKSNAVPSWMHMYTMEDAVRDLRAGKVPNVKPIYTFNTGLDLYSKADIYQRWHNVEQAYIAKQIRLKNMKACPTKLPSSCNSCNVGETDWRTYGSGNPALSYFFHCGYRGVIENRVPTPSNPAPAQECFYDDKGKLVDESHPDAKCRGTPDYFPYFNGLDDADKARKDPHANIDTGGPSGPSRHSADLMSEAGFYSLKHIAIIRPGNAIKETLSE